MNQNILKLFRAPNTSHLSAINLANSLHASVPAIVQALLKLRAAGSVSSWGSGTPYMLYWSAKS